MKDEILKLLDRRIRKWARAESKRRKQWERRYAGKSHSVRTGGAAQHDLKCSNYFLDKKQEAQAIKALVVELYHQHPAEGGK